MKVLPLCLALLLLSACTLHEVQRAVYASGANYQCQKNTEANPTAQEKYPKGCIMENSLDGKSFEEYAADKKSGK